MKNRRIFISGIGTEIGKTVVSSIFVKALKADYWKPVQAGDLDYSDTDKVKEWVNSSESTFYPNAYPLQHPMSPHAAAARESIRINPASITRPETSNNLIIEGAGGLLVPLNEEHTILDLMRKDDEIVLVSRNYLGSINHSLMSLEILKTRGLKIWGIVICGEPNPESEEIIEKMSGIPIRLRIPYIETINADSIAQIAEQSRKEIEKAG